MTKAIVTFRMTEHHFQRLESRCEVVLAGWGKTGNCLPESELSVLVQDADFLLVGYEVISAGIINAAKKLQLIGCARSNPVNVDIASASLRGIPVLHTPGRNAIAAAEFTIGLILAEARHIARGYLALKTGAYLGDHENQGDQQGINDDVIWNLDGKSPYKDFRGVELYDRTLGLIGLGNVGAKVAQLAQAFGMRVIANSPYISVDKANSMGVELVSLEQLLQTSDFVSLHCKVTEETCGLLGARELGLMKSSAYLINTARASLIDQDALLEALRTKRISGAALDVYWCEPLSASHPLLKMDNVTLTPHLAGATDEVAERHSKMIVDDVLDWMDGTRPKHVFNPEVLSKE